MADSKVVIRRFRVGDIEMDVDPVEGTSLKDACEQAGVRFEGAAFKLNGARVSEREVDATTLKAGDTVQVLDKPRGGE